MVELQYNEMKIWLKIRIIKKDYYFYSNADISLQLWKYVQLCETVCEIVTLQFDHLKEFLDNCTSKFQEIQQLNFSEEPSLYQHITIKYGNIYQHQLMIC